MRYIIVFFLFAGLLKAQELDLRRATLGAIIDNPATADLKKLCDRYNTEQDSSEWMANYGCKPKFCFHLLCHQGKIVSLRSPLPLGSLRKAVFNYLQNPQQEIVKSDSVIYSKVKGQEVYIAKGLVVVQYDRVLTDFTLAVIREAAAGIHDYRDYIARKFYNKSYSDLDEEAAANLRDFINSKLIIEYRNAVPPPPPPPPPLDEYSSGNSVQAPPSPEPDFIKDYESKPIVAAGTLLSQRLDFENIVKVELRNVKGLHDLSSPNWNSLKPLLMDSRATGSLVCKPSGPCLYFHMKDGSIIRACLCDDLINFEAPFEGSFRLEKKLNFHNY